MNARSFYVKVRARTGVCLGGVKSYDSSRFETYEQAENWRETALTENLRAGRDVYTVVFDSKLAPEIKVQS